MENFVTEEFRREIADIYVLPSFRRDIIMLSENKFSQRVNSDRLSLLAKITTGCAALASSAALAWFGTVRELSYLSIFLSTSSVVLHGISTFLLKNSHTNSKQLTDALSSIGVIHLTATRQVSELKEDI